MANHKSALKRARQNVVRRTRNRTSKTRIKHVVKEIRLAVNENSPESASKLDVAKSVIDKAAKKGRFIREPLPGKYPVFPSLSTLLPLNMVSADSGQDEQNCMDSI